jgi:hypothetical protein
MTIDGVWIGNRIYATRDYTLQITVTQRLVFSVTVFTALLPTVDEPLLPGHVPLLASQFWHSADTPQYDLFRTVRREMDSRQKPQQHRFWVPSSFLHERREIFPSGERGKVTRACIWPLIFICGGVVMQPKLRTARRRGTASTALQKCYIQYT